MKATIEMVFCGTKRKIKEAYFFSPDICLLSPLSTLFLHLSVLQTRERL